MELTTELYKAIGLFNQTLKRYKTYIFDKDLGLFIGRTDGYQFLYAPPLDIEDFPDIFSESFIIEDGNALFGFLKDNKKVGLDNRTLINEKGETLLLKSFKGNLSEQKYTILDHVDEIDEVAPLIDGSSSKLYLDGELASDEGFTINDIVDILKDLIGKSSSDHTLPIFQLKDDELHVYSEFTDVNLNELFVVLDTEAFRKVKLLKADTPFIKFYHLKESGKILIEYGALEKEHFIISVSGIFRL